MSITAIYPGYDQPDIGRVTYGGNTYTCYVWQRPGALAIIAAIYLELEDGGHTLLDGPRVVVAQSDRAYTMESPKVIGRVDAGGSGCFILHALETETDGTGSIIYRWIFELNDFETGWQSAGATATTHEDALYDVDVVHGSDTDFVLAHKNQSGTEISFGRWEPPWGTADTVWLSTETLECEARVLGVWCSDDVGVDGTVLITRQLDDGGSDPHQLWTFRCDANDGSGSPADVETFGTTNVLVTGTNEYLQVRHALVSSAGSAAIGIVVELQTVADQTATVGPEPYSRYVGWTFVTYEAVVLAEPQNIPGVSLHGAWPYASGVALVNNLYAMIGFTTLTDGQEWQQMNGYVVDLDYIGTLQASAAGVVEAKPVMSWTDGSFDARISGRHSVPGNNVPGITGGVARRMNHLSHTVRPPQYATGSKLKTVETAGVAWELLMPVPDGSEVELHPTQASIRGYEFHHEDPWLHRRDSSEPTAPSTQNVKTCAPWSIGQHVDLGDFAHFSGGVQHVYAGGRLAELGYLWAPQILATSANGSTSDGSGMVDDGEYYYTLTYAWRDEHGHLHRSAPATPLLHTQEADAEGVTIYARTMTISMKDRTVDQGARPISIELWRTYYESGIAATDTTTGTYLFRRVFCTPGTNTATMGIVGTPINDRTDWWQSFDDGQSDAEVALAELLPWQLDTTTLQWNLPTPIPPPACDVSAAWTNRLWVAKNDRIYYSTEFSYYGTQRLAPEFNDVNVYQLDFRGPITGLVPMDESLAVFTRSQVLMIYGEGNDGTGSGATLRHSVIANGIGCIEPRSLVLAPAFGVFFQADRGIYLLSRETGVEYVGKDVEDLVREAGNVRAATLLEDRHQVRFTVNGAPTASDVSPRVLVYDYLRKLWSIIDAPEVGSASTERLNEMQAATSWRGEAGEVLHVFLQSGGLAIERAFDDTVFADTTHTATVAIPIDITTDWISLAGIAGLKRVREVGINTRRLNDGEMSVDYFYDNDGSFNDAQTPETKTWASPAPAYMPGMFAVQKVSAIKLRIYESGSVPQTENVRLEAITLKAGIKRGPRKVPASQRGT